MVSLLLEREAEERKGDGAEEGLSINKVDNEPGFGKYDVSAEMKFSMSRSIRFQLKNLSSD
jgi:hypothetical protein